MRGQTQEHFGASSLPKPSPKYTVAGYEREMISILFGNLHVKASYYIVKGGTERHDCLNSSLPLSYLPPHPHTIDRVCVCSRHPIIL